MISPRTTFDSEVVRITDHAVTSDFVVGHSYRNCLIVGPAVLILQGETNITSCTFPGAVADFFWSIDNRAKVVGAIGMVDASFDQCSFQRIGFAGDENLRELFQQGLVEGENGESV